MKKSWKPQSNIACPAAKWNLACLRPVAIVIHQNRTKWSKNSLCMWFYHPGMPESTQDRLILHPTFVMKKFQNRIKNLQRWMLSKLFRISWIWISRNHSVSRASFWSYFHLCSPRKNQNSRFQQFPKRIINNHAPMCELASLDFLRSSMKHIGTPISIFRQFQQNSLKN